MRAYIEPHDDEEDNFSILIHSEDVLLGKIDCPPKEWLYTITNEDGDLVLNYSAGMEESKWDYITNEIIGQNREQTWQI